MNKLLSRGHPWEAKEPDVISLMKNEGKKIEELNAPTLKFPLNRQNPRVVYKNMVDRLFFILVKGEEVRRSINTTRQKVGMRACSAGASFAGLLMSAKVSTQENRVALDEEQLLFIARGQDNAVDEDVDEQPVQGLALNVDNVFQADECDTFDSNVDEAPTTQTMFMVNLSSVYPVYDEAGPSYDSNILSKVHDHDHYQNTICEHHEVHEMHDVVQPNYVVDSHADCTSDSNMISYDQYVKDNAVSVVQSNVSFVTNDAYMMIK
uniref:Retrovirus-related Pol polyprotein from transposon TNT 1-94 n=1 Tax=Tanacetum cinerariifolium TaxID=118510 RepID=A0A699H189_TANCI|nr:retrovirus-related Pol polyprotein from transposon TNT 1-94 [Tanacetum cinerariifolium]